MKELMMNEWTNKWINEHIVRTEMNARRCWKTRAARPSVVLRRRLAWTWTRKPRAQRTTDEPLWRRWPVTDSHTDWRRRRAACRHTDTLRPRPPSRLTRAAAAPAASPTSGPSAVSIATATLTTRLLWKHDNNCSGLYGRRRQKAALSDAFRPHDQSFINAVLATDRLDISVTAHRPHVTMTSPTKTIIHVEWWSQKA